MVVPLVVPSTRTSWPAVIALAEIEVAPFWNVVEDVSSTVTFCPADVDNVKPGVDTLATVPTAPPEAGPDRALDPPPPDPKPPAEPLPAAVAEGDVAVAEDAPQAESPITRHVSTAPRIHRLLLFDADIVSWVLVGS
jgi:hypothetical protein